MTLKKAPSMESQWLTVLLDMESKGFSGMSSGRLYRKGPAERLLGKGLVEAKMLLVCDGDGFTLGPSERFSRGYVLTPAGRKRAKVLDTEGASE